MNRLVAKNHLLKFEICTVLECWKGALLNTRALQKLLEIENEVSQKYIPMVFYDKEAQDLILMFFS